MRISGRWFTFEDGYTRPLIRAKVVGIRESRIAEEFLIDTGADRTVISAAVLNKLDLPTMRREDGTALVGVGGSTDSVVISTVLGFVRENGTVIHVRGDFAAFVSESLSDLSVLGRDVLDNFDVIISRRRNEVLLLAGHHRYSIELES